MIDHDECETAIADSPPVDNATAALTSDRLAWMAAARQMGGWR